MPGELGATATHTGLETAPPDWICTRVDVFPSSAYGAIAARLLDVTEISVAGIWSNSSCVLDAGPKPAPLSVIISPTDIAPPNWLAAFRTLSSRMFGMPDMSYTVTKAF